MPIADLLLGPLGASGELEPLRLLLQARLPLLRLRRLPGQSQSADHSQSVRDQSAITHSQEETHIVWEWKIPAASYICMPMVGWTNVSYWRIYMMRR